MQRVTHDHVDIQVGVEDALQGALNTSLQTGAQKQVLRRIAGERKLRKRNDVGSKLVPRAARGGNQLVCIALDVADQQIQLSHHYR
jgi:hypothetical protein